MKNFSCAPVVICIGTDRVTGDSLGPIVGELLVRAFNVKAFVYGSLSRPVTALNVSKAAAFVRTKHRGSIVVAVDCSVGANVGEVSVRRGGLRPGLAVGKVLCPVGDVSVTATVASSANLLGSARLSDVFSLAAKVARVIANALGSAKTAPSSRFAL